MIFICYILVLITGTACYIAWYWYKAWKKDVERFGREIIGKRPCPSPAPPPKKTEVDMLREYIKSQEFEKRVEKIVQMLNTRR